MRISLIDPGFEAYPWETVVPLAILAHEADFLNLFMTVNIKERVEGMNGGERGLGNMFSYQSVPIKKESMAHKSYQGIPRARYISSYRIFIF
jgi:hypothetical protein